MDRNLTELAGLFLKLGFTAFGGPAAHIAMMHDEVVERRKWLQDDEFLDLIGATNLIPGPNSTEMAIHLGLMRAGWQGLILAGVCFILPAMLLVMVLAWVYTRYGATPQADLAALWAAAGGDRHHRPGALEPGPEGDQGDHGSTLRVCRPPSLPGGN